jgi:hypothetical protein
MKERNALVILIFAYFAGLLVFGGCRTPVANYTIQTAVPDVWAESPKQSVAFKMEFRK